ncbi:sensor histidine kinase [Aquibium oceanicum]|uniref:sensor histidine kinase n=1 Tax=Aquibium oceanicum TaxID=1670800 RepID=UPI0012FF9ED6|nr:sensor histidine kinase [Aquibium oceanicum]
MTLVTTLPLVIYALVVVDQLRSSEYASLQRRTSREAASVAQLVGQQLRDMTTTLKVLGTAPELEAADFAEFHARGTEALSESNWFLIVADAAGRQLLNTRVPFGTPLATVSDVATLRAVLETSTARVSDVFFGKTSGTWVYNVMLRVPGPQSRPLALILTQNVTVLESSLGKRPLPDEWHFALLDGRNAVVVSSNGLESGAPFSEPLLAQVAAEDLGPERARDTEVLLGYAKVPGTDWQAIIWGPRSSAAGQISDSMRNLILGGTAFFLMSLLCGLFLGRRLQQSIAGIAQRAERMGRGEIVSPLDSGFREIDGVSVALSEASFDRSQAEDRVQTVLGELSHRTKNVILIVQALMTQTLRQTDDLASFRTAMTGRLTALARSLDLLTSRNWGDASLIELIRAQLDVFGIDADRVELDGENFEIRSGAVKDFGMMLHEMATNATKYGALSVPEGRLRIRWSGEAAADLLHFVWEERGGPSVSEPDALGFGSRLMQATAGSLNGTARCSYDPDGVRWILELPLARIRGGQSAGPSGAA